MPPARATRSTDVREAGRERAAARATQAWMASDAPLRMAVPLVWTPLMRVSALKGTNSRPRGDLLALAQAEALLGEDDDRAALGGLVGQRGELGRLGQVALA